MSGLLRKNRLILITAIAVIAACGSGTFGLLTREPTLEGRTVLSWLRKYEGECCFSSGNEAWSVFHRNGRKAIPGLVRIIKARPPLFAHVVATHRWFSAHLPSWIESWAWQKDAAALGDRCWAIMLCAEFGAEARAAHPA